MLFSSLQQGEIPGLERVAGAVISTLILFFQLRVADEFKDFDIDSKYRSHRPVPSGLVTLAELRRLAWLGAAIQFYVAVSIDIGLLPVLLIVWLYMGLMTKEFFVPEWLKKTPSVYLLSHMLVMPLIAFYVSAFDWLCDCREMPTGLGWLLLLSFGCGLVLELGRKIKTPGAERQGVETYSALWGTGVSVSIWAASVVMAVVAYSRAAELITGSTLYVSIGTGIVVLSVSMIVALLFRTNVEHPGTGKLIEPVSGVVAMLLYIGLGPLQALLV